MLEFCRQQQDMGIVVGKGESPGLAASSLKGRVRTIGERRRGAGKGHEGQTDDLWPHLEALLLLVDKVRRVGVCAFAGP
jgi:hypothetical protein